MIKKNGIKRVEGSNSLYRNEKGAIVNLDENAYKAYIKKRQSSKTKTETIESLGSQLAEAKSEIEELKSLIKQFLDK